MCVRCLPLLVVVAIVGLIAHWYQFPVRIILVCLGALRRAALVALAEVVVGVVGVVGCVCVHFATFEALAFLIFVVVVFTVALSVAVVVVRAFVLDTVFFALGVASIE